MLGQRFIRRQNQMAHLCREVQIFEASFLIFIRFHTHIIQIIRNYVIKIKYWTHLFRMLLHYCHPLLWWETYIGIKEGDAGFHDRPSLNLWHGAMPIKRLSPSWYQWLNNPQNLTPPICPVLSLNILIKGRRINYVNTTFTLASDVKCL